MRNVPPPETNASWQSDPQYCSPYYLNFQQPPTAPQYYYQGAYPYLQTHPMPYFFPASPQTPLQTPPPPPLQTPLQTPPPPPL